MCARREHCVLRGGRYTGIVLGLFLVLSVFLPTLLPRAIQADRSSRDRVHPILPDQAHLPAAGTVLRVLRTTNNPVAIAIDEPLHRAYVLIQAAYVSPKTQTIIYPPSQVLILDTRTARVMLTVSVGQRSNAISVDVQTQRVFVLNEGCRTVAYTCATTVSTVSVLNAMTGTLVRTVPIGVGPFMMVIDQHLNRVFIPAPESTPTQASVLSVLNARSGVVMYQLHIGQALSSLTIDESTNHAFVLNAANPATILMIDARTGAVLKTIPVGVSPAGVILTDPMQHRVFVETSFVDGGPPYLVILDSVHGTLIKTVRFPPVVVVNATSHVWQPASVAVDDRTHLLVTGNTATSQIHLIAGSSGTLIRTITLSQPGWAVAIDSAARQAYILTGGANGNLDVPTAGVSTVNVDTGAVLRTLDLGMHHPSTLTLDTQDHHLFVATLAATDESGNPISSTVSMVATDIPSGAPASSPARQSSATSVSAACCGARYFPQTHHNLSGSFLVFYQQYGGLDTFGYPRTEPFTETQLAPETGHLVQYTDRFELELVNGRVETVALGRLLTAGSAFPRVAPFPGSATRLYFASTGHSLSGRFLAYWQSHHGAILLGPPIAEPDNETNGDGTGRSYLVQWFANSRLEYHPERAGTLYAVQIGLVGKQALAQRGWL